MAQTLIGTPIPWIPIQNFLDTTSTRQLNAAGESASMIGYIHLSTGPGTSKTISAAGSGKIHFSPNAVVFADAGTNFRVGLQDVDAATGIEDTTYDVRGDLTGGGGGIVTNTLCTVTMGTGTKTVNHGDMIAAVFEMTTRGGVDSVTVNSIGPGNIPYGTFDNGSGPTKAGVGTLCLIEFDDGTIGYFAPVTNCYTASTTSFNSGSTPDEHALIFQVPVPVTICGIVAYMGEFDTTETGNFKIYTTPTGTPSATATIAFDPDMVFTDANGLLVYAYIPAGLSLSAATDYAVAYEATSAGNRTIRQATYPSANCRAMFPFGTTMLGASRSNGAGAFGSTSTTVFPALGILVSSVDDGTAGGGGGGGSFTFVG
jgi:hypothetical protein